MASAELQKMAVPVPFVCLQVQDLQNELREEKQISRRFATEEACSTLSSVGNDLQSMCYTFDT